MKISKLFHWLYAILMFLPIMVFIPNAFYYGFNEHAVAQEKTEQVPVYYESNVIESSNNLTNGNVYHWTDNFNTDTSNAGKYLFTIVNTDFTNNQLNQNNDYTTARILINSQGNAFIDFYNGNTYLRSLNINNALFDFVLLAYSSTNIDIAINHITYTTNKYIKEYQPLITNMSITDSMSYAWDSVWQNDLFSWSYDSFLTAPFLYITNLFNVPSTNTLVYCLSYWLNISLIWLTFDLVMYVPLLVHRWLDKGVIE